MDGADRLAAGYAVLGLSEAHFNRVIDRARSRFAALLGPEHTPRTLFSLVLLL
jgi:hypothetical protein